MNNAKHTIVETGRLMYYYVLKSLLIVIEEIISFLSKLPKIITLTTLTIGIIFSIKFMFEGYLNTGLKFLVVISAISLAIYFILLLMFKPLMNPIFILLEKVRKIHHNYNCGIYMEHYKIRLLKEKSIERMLNLKELLETNILLSGLLLKTKLIFDDENMINYRNILSNGLSIGTALCFSPDTFVDYGDNTIREFAIENDAFIKEFDRLCKENDDIKLQIEFLKQNKKRISKEM